MNRIANFKKAFGPGILFAGTAIGVSHLVQSTRAGADYGYALVWAIVLANFFKYPFFEFGARYAQSTQTTLIDGYQKLGRKYVWLYILITVASMFTVTAAVSYVTTAVITTITGLDSAFMFKAQAVVLYLACMVMLLIGKYKALDKFIKTLGLLLLVAVLSSMIMLFVKNNEAAVLPEVLPFWESRNQFLFLVALMGWMPTALDLSTWSSIWTVERIKETGYVPSLKESLLDFKIGYIISAVLAICFLVMGAEMLFYTGKTLPESASGFATSIIGLFTSLVGEWSYFIIAFAAFSVMLSTTITVFDGYARAMSVTSAIFKRHNLNYPFWLIITAAGGLIVVLFFSQGIKPLVDLATIISFLIAPVVAWLNYRLVTSNHLPAKAKPAKWLRIWALAGFFFLLGFALVFLFLAFS